MYRIGDFSNLTGLSVKTLRYYDEIGILKPSYIDEFTGYRYYTDDNMSQVRVIEELKACQFKLEEIKFVLDKGLDLETVTRKQDEINNNINDLYNAYNFLDGLRENLQMEENKKNGIKVKKLVSNEKKTA